VTTTSIQEADRLSNPRQPTVSQLSNYGGRKSTSSDKFSEVFLLSNHKKPRS